MGNFTQSQQKSAGAGENPGIWATRVLLFYRRPNEIKNSISYEIGFPISLSVNFKPQMRLKILSHTR